MTVHISKSKESERANYAFGDLEEDFQCADRSDKRKRIFLMITLFLVVSGSGIAISEYRNSHPSSAESSSSSEGDMSSENTKPVIAADDVGKEDSSQVTAQPVQRQTPPNTSATTPAAQPFDQASFTTTGRSVLSHYNQIVGLVTFGPSTSHEQRVAGIKQAYALDKQYFNEVTNLRMLINSADSVPSKYTNLVNLAENGVSAVSVGVGELYGWATGSSTSSVDSGNGMVSQGAASLLQFSQQL